MTATQLRYSVDHDLTKRWLSHRSNIRGGRGRLGVLGTVEAEFAFSPLLICAAGQRRFYEERALAVYRKQAGCLNVSEYGNGADRQSPDGGTVNVHVILPVTVYNQLVAKAKATGESLSTLIRQYIARGLAK